MTPTHLHEVMTMLKRIQVQVILATLLALTLASPPGAGARLIEGVYFKPRVMASGIPMVLNGVGLKKLWQVVKVSVAALYLGEGVSPSSVLTNVPKRLEIEYFHAISAKDFATLTEKLLKQNADPSNISRLQSRLDRLNALYRDVQPGYRYALTYVPEEGTTLALNGVDLGTIEGEDFAAAVFSMWLGPRPLSNALKGELLGRS
jgi:hypothetical protein